MVSTFKVLKTKINYEILLVSEAFYLKPKNGTNCRGRIEERKIYHTKEIVKNIPRLKLNVKQKGNHLMPLLFHSIIASHFYILTQSVFYNHFDTLSLKMNEIIYSYCTTIVKYITSL